MKIKIEPENAVSNCFDFLYTDKKGSCFNILDTDDELLGVIHGPDCFRYKSGRWEVRVLLRPFGEQQLIERCKTLEEAKVAAIAYWF